MLRRYYFGDFARKVVGVGSVGTEAFVVLLLGDRDDEPLFLQLKEAQESVLAPFAGESEHRHQGERVVRGQLLTQAAPDPFLGWTSGVRDQRPGCEQGLLRAPAARHEGQHERLPDGPAPAQLLRQALRLGAGPRARPDRRAAVISGYLGGNEDFDHAIADFALAYADQNEKDYQRLLEAVSAARVLATVEQ